MASNVTTAQQLTSENNSVPCCTHGVAAGLGFCRQGLCGTPAPSQMALTVPKSGQVPLPTSSKPSMHSIPSLQSPWSASGGFAAHPELDNSALLGSDDLFDESDVGDSLEGSPVRDTAATEPHVGDGLV